MGLSLLAFTSLIFFFSYSMLPAITTEGIIYSHIKTGSYNGDQFIQWLEGLLRVMNPYPGPRSVLVLDNCRIHHVEGVQELCEERHVYHSCRSRLIAYIFYASQSRGVRLIYLPPYSPDLNPIEECFSWVKKYIERHGQRFRDVVELGDEADPYLFLYHVLDQVPISACQAWFQHSGYI